MISTMDNLELDTVQDVPLNMDQYSRVSAAAVAIRSVLLYGVQYSRLTCL